MLGRRLVERIRADGVGGRAVEEFVLSDLVVPTGDQVAGVTWVDGDIGDPDVADLLASLEVDLVFHLGAVVSGDAERDHELGYDVNVGGTWHLLEGARLNPDWCPRFVFASSIAVFGGPFPPAVHDDFRASPRSSYGTQKAIGELLLSDYTRRGAVDGVAVRLPTVAIRPGSANGAASGFFSSIVREPLAGRRAVLPVRRDLVHWFVSPSTAVAQLIHAATLDTASLGADRALTMPGLEASVQSLLDGLERAAGRDALDLVDEVPDPEVAAIVETWPERFDARRALSLGFPVDDTVDAIVAEHVSTVAHDLAASGAVSAERAAVATDGDPEPEVIGLVFHDAASTGDVTGLDGDRPEPQEPEPPTGVDEPMSDSEDAATAVIEKVRRFIETLDDAERQVFAAMLAPAVSEAWADEPEVAGFDGAWTPTRVRDHLNRAIRDQRFVIERRPDA